MKKGFRTIFFVAILFVGGYAGFTLSKWFGRGSHFIEEKTTTVIQQVQTLSDLVTVKYVLQKVEIMDAPPDTTIGKFIQGDNRVLLLAFGVVKAGIELKQLRPEDVTISGRNICLKLPPSRITDSYLDDSRTQVIERTTGFLRALDKDLEQTTRQNAVLDVSRAARENGILKDADERARLQLTTFLKQEGFEQVSFR